MVLKIVFIADYVKKYINLHDFAHGVLIFFVCAP